jgi:hypothetical protein
MRSALLRALPFALLAACSEPTSEPGSPQFELVDPAHRLDAASVNAHVYGSFRVGVGSGASTVITSGPANFPKHPPAGSGTCVDGRWLNPQGRPTSGTLAKPHPHCLQAALSVEVVLEPISACFSPTTTGCKRKAVKSYTAGAAVLGTVDDETTSAVLEGWQPLDPSNPDTPPLTSGAGTITGYAIDAATLGTTNRRVGTIRIDLAAFNSDSVNLLDVDGSDGCSIDSTILAPFLNRVITARYDPLPVPDGIGRVDYAIEGFLWFAPASAPYNYDPTL